ncbi:hypothetical protein GBF38_013012 [Nibea albiflora]|uniref:Uncharacterized protein n=1 Tax=Nibea albiflora TaxID=240163 RepID=A0ACB7EZX2_NIBAL|nr:hypothetical protein GBF38_013012 [Nibea albiflora]
MAALIDRWVPLQELSAHQQLHVISITSARASVIVLETERSRVTVVQSETRTRSIDHSIADSSRGAPVGHLSTAELI